MNKDEAGKEVEELRSAISKYKSTIRLGERKKLKYYNKVYQEKTQQKSKLREEEILAKVNTLIPPSLSTLYIPNLYETLKKICKIYVVSLKIIPTLFVPAPYSFLFSNSKGIIQLEESESAFDLFFSSAKGVKNAYAYPECVLKRKNKKMRFFLTAQYAKNYLSANLNEEGMLQHYVHSNTEKQGIGKVLWKDQKFKYFLLTNKAKIAKKPRSQSVAVSKPRLSNQEHAFFDSLNPQKQENLTNQSRKSVISQPVVQSTGIIQRIQKNIINPWQIPKPSVFHLSKIDSAKFVIGGKGLSECSTTRISVIFPEIEKTIQNLRVLLKKFIISDKYEITEIASSFVRDSNKNWILLDCSLIKVNKFKFKEITCDESEMILSLKPDSDSEQYDDQTMCMINDSKLEKEPMKTLNHNFSLKSQNSFVPGMNSSFQEKYRKTITKIDRIRHKNRLNSNLATTFDLVIDYKSNYKIDRNGGIQSLILSHSAIKPFVKIYENTPKASQKTNSVERYKKLFSSSSSYDVCGATDTFTKHCEESVESYENIIQSIKKTYFQTIRLDEKYGGRKFLLNFSMEFLKRVQNCILAKYLWVKDGFEVMCPGMQLVFNCQVSVSLAKQLFNTHSKFAIPKDDFDVFTDVFLNTLKELDFSETDLEYIALLLLKLSRDIINKKSHQGNFKQRKMSEVKFSEQILN